MGVSALLLEQREERGAAEQAGTALKNLVFAYTCLLTRTRVRLQLQQGFSMGSLQL